NSIGSKVLECDPKSGDCPCYANFTGRQCDRCAAGYYDYPYCKPCSCLLSGSKGMTCDNHGQVRTFNDRLISPVESIKEKYFQCYCKPNFQGERCDQCKINFYNFPICEGILNVVLFEECNCNPSGVVASFAGCDKVAPGELCTCRANVIGRICDQCRPTFWDLQYQHPEGCISCNCNLPGTVSTLNVCDPLNGQCFCKRHVAGRRCERCADGFYELESHSQLGCHLSMLHNITAFFFSQHANAILEVRSELVATSTQDSVDVDLVSLVYEAEDGITPENRTVRFAADKTQFPNFSWRGFAVFSPIQDEIIIDMVVHKASLYRVLFHYVNPTPVNIGAEDYVVLLPSEYYEGSLLKERVTEPCHAHSTENVTCVDLLYPPLPVAARFDVNEDRTVNEISEDGAEAALEKVPIEMLPAVIGPAAFVRADNRSREVRIELDVSTRYSNDISL
uniref:Laminin EGF-like domain-containing protein n=1 Tax=Parascaris equorum TaxID=6256 RepID=A0A914S9Z1_PAREQ